MLLEKIKDFLLSPQLWGSVLVIALCMALWFVLKHFIHKYLSRDRVQGKKETHTRFAALIVKYLIVIFTLVTVLQINGINVTSLVTGLGIAGIIIGFALQDILKDFIMGINIVGDEFFLIGDVVRYKTIEGKVVYFNMKVTKIFDVNTGNTFTISNRNISEIEKISDWQDVLVPAPYEINAETMRGICRDICQKACELQDVTDCEFLGTDQFGESQVNYRIRLHCLPERKAPTRRAALGIIQDTLAANHIQIPYPHVDVVAGTCDHHE